MRKLLLKLATSAAALILSLLLVEAALRVFGFSYPSFYKLDNYRGWANRPGSEGWYVKEGKAYVRINRDGFRDSDHTIVKPENTVRIAVLGDSFTEALQVPIESTFWRVLEERLAACGVFDGKTVEVLGFGGSGYGTAQELIVYRRYASRYDPDIVLLAFFSGNDITDNYRPLDHNFLKPYFVRHGHNLILDDSFREQIKPNFSNLHWGHIASLVDRFRTLQLLKIARHKGLRSFRSRESEGEVFNIGTSTRVFSPPEDNNWSEAWHTTELLISTLGEEVENAGSKFWIVSIPVPIQVHPDAKFRKNFMKFHSLKDLSYSEHRIELLAETKGFFFVRLTDEFIKNIESEKLFLYGFGEQMGNGHWNIFGHQFAGEIIAQRMCEEPAGRVQK